MTYRYLSLCLLLVLALCSVKSTAEKAKPKSIAKELCSYLQADRESRDTALKALLKLNPTWEAVEAAMKARYTKIKSDGLTEKTIEVGGDDYTFFFALPKGYKLEKSYPLILSLTFGPGAPDMAKQMYEGYWKENAEDYIVLQLPVRNKLFFQGGDDVIEPALRWAVANLNVDVDRIYLAGASNGGNGACWFVLRRGDLFAGMLVFPGILANLKQSLIKKDDPELTNLKGIKMVFWAGGKDPQWANTAKACVDALKNCGIDAKFVLSEFEQHLPSQNVDIPELMDAFSEKNARPSTYGWYFFEENYPCARNIEFAELLPSKPVTVEMEKGLVTLEGFGEYEFTIYLTDADLADGKVKIVADDENLFEGAPPADVESRLRAIYAGLLTGGYTWAITLNKD